MKALLVEDSRELRTVLRKALEKEGYAVDEAEDGAAGSFAARTNEYDVVILDNELPRKPGLLVCQEVRQAGRTTPILMLSVRADAVEKAAHLDAGADDYVAKPFSFDELKSRLRALTRRPRGIDMPTVTVGPVTLDAARFHVEVSGVPVYLARREFALLEHLVRRAGRVVTRAELIERVWESAVSPISNTVETHVLSVRRKLGADGAKILKSVPGRGYMADDKPHLWERPLPSARRKAAASGRAPSSR